LPLGHFAAIIGARKEIVMQSYLFIGGRQDGRNISLRVDLESVQMPVGARGKETYVRETLAIGGASIAIYRHEGLTSEQVLDLLIKHYKAWFANRYGGQ
jgi:hypothetical protein